ncbi:hypothetical protein [Wenjunlia tyrosinilytica]|uniref:Uncharacterized protein n=1 Tax=Wenjunlia tyrosinilytica TaxID=1544741 RepID=A0A918E104_9ACTN|nr:hypothetical protein [Wenjunlia tyrosinilytica]GGO94625.1 hypothetical protein GCM10012280_49970 [Wenjunlia tyrosinilytica]
MSWSMFRFREHWAHAHDVQQETFMALAAMYVEANPTYRAVPWLREWQAFWLRSIGRQANGLTDVCADDYLTDDGRVAQFREFLRDYQSWLVASEGPLVTAAGLSADKLVEFTQTVDAVLAGDETHPTVQLVQQ